MKFQLDLRFESTEKISCTDHIFLAGSCFAENIGERFRDARFHTAINPSGILYNPQSLSASIRRIMSGNQYTEKELVQNADLWHSLQHHGCFSSPEKDKTLNAINGEFSVASNALKKTGWLIITFGSAFAWKHFASGNIVANCHKIPAKEFEKVFLDADSIVPDWLQLLSELKKFNPKLRVMFTVSPVRYIRDGIIENNKSKAALITAVHSLCEQTGALYYPAYEYVTDVLRDYRFYKEDMVHPTDQAVNFVWEKFSEQMFDRQTKEIVAEIEKFNSLSRHIPLHDQTAHEKNVAKQCAKLQERYPFLNWQ